MHSMHNAARATIDGDKYWCDWTKLTSCKDGKVDRDYSEDTAYYVNYGIVGPKVTCGRCGGSGTISCGKTWNWQSWFSTHSCDTCDLKHACKSCMEKHVCPN